jgi:hypothetical protein
MKRVGRVAAAAWRTSTPVLSLRRADLLMLALGAGGGVAILWLGRGWDLFFFDDWGAIFYRREGGLDAFLAPHNGHLQAVLIAAYRVLFETAGLENYLPYRLTILLAHVALVALIYVYARRRVQPELAVVLSLLVLMLGAGWEVIYWPYTLGFPVPLGALVAILLLWERRGRAAAAARTVLMIVALASSALGLAVVAAVVVEALWRADRWRRLAEPVLALVPYVLWFLLYRSSGSTPAELRRIPGANPTGDVYVTDIQVPSVLDGVGYAFDLAKAGVNGVLGFGPEAGPVVPVVVLLAGVGLLLARRSLRPRVVSIFAGLGAFWVSLVAARGAFEAGPVASRYVYVSGVFLVLLAVEVLVGVRLRRALLPVVAAAAIVVIASQVGTFQEVAKGAEAAFARHRAELRALSDPGVPADFMPDPESLPGVAAGPYREAVTDLGYPDGTEP